MKKVAAVAKERSRPSKSKSGNSLSNHILGAIAFFFERRYFPDWIYNKLPAVAILSSIILFASPEVMQLFLGKLGATALAVYGIVILWLRVKRFGR
jgi:hypothetical protein